MATHSSILAWRIPWTQEPGGYSPRGRKELDMTGETKHTCTHAWFQEPDRSYKNCLPPRVQLPRPNGSHLKIVAIVFWYSTFFNSLHILLLQGIICWLLLRILLFFSTLCAVPHTLYFRSKKSCLLQKSQVSCLILRDMEGSEVE